MKPLASTFASVARARARTSGFARRIPERAHRPVRARRRARAPPRSSLKVDVSGAKPKRDVLEGIIRAIEAGELGGVVVAKLDRLSPRRRATASTFRADRCPGGVIRSASETSTSRRRRTFRARFFSASRVCNGRNTGTDSGSEGECDRKWDRNKDARCLSATGSTSATGLRPVAGDASSSTSIFRCRLDGRFLWRAPDAVRAGDRSELLPRVDAISSDEPLLPRRAPLRQGRADREHRSARGDRRRRALCRGASGERGARRRAGRPDERQGQEPPSRNRAVRRMRSRPDPIANGLASDYSYKCPADTSHCSARAHVQAERARRLRRRRRPRMGRAGGRRARRARSRARAGRRPDRRRAPARRGRGAPRRMVGGPRRSGHESEGV